MKIELWHIVFTILFIFLVFWFFAKGAYVTKEEDVTVTYTEYLTNACDDAMSTVDQEETIVFDTEAKRKKALEQFYHTLGRNFNNIDTNKESLLYDKIPCVLLIDNNGFYVSYTEKYIASDGMHYSGQVCSGINTWLGKYDVYFVQFYLDDTIKVTKSGSDRIVRGYYADVYEELVNSGMSVANLTFLQNKESFLLEKDAIIINEVNEQAEYYINSHNKAFGNNYLNYSFTMTKSEQDDLQGKLVEPAVLSFIQGPQTTISDEWINVYALSASQRKQMLTYSVCKNEAGYLYYHEKGCSEIKEDLKVVRTMRDAAAHGADPCPKCMRK